MSELFMPHGMCYLWRTDVLILHVLSDAVIAGSYFSIPLALLYFARRRTDLAYKWVLFLFAAFIVGCGITHLLGIWVTWNPDYLAEGTAKAATAAVSVATAIVLWLLIPKLLALPSPVQLSEANRSLEREVLRRMDAQKKLEKLNRELEHRVSERTRELARSNEELEKFAYHASHDLKAPLRAVTQLSQWIGADLAEDADEELRENLDLMQSRVKRMNTMLDDLLQYARIASPSNDEYNEDVDARRLVDDVLSLIQIPDHMEVNVSPGLSGVMVKRMPLQQVFLNLLSNAIRHHDKPKGRIDIRVEERGDFHAISVTDDGPGIAPEHHEVIFEMFRTLARRDDVESSGVGLAVVRRAVDTFGGRIEIDSSPGHGSTFTVLWPAGPSPVPG